MHKSNLALAAVAIALLVGCNDSDNGSSAPVDNGGNGTLQSYAFIDEPVEGLYFKSATQSGCTDSDGTYKVYSDESVIFSLGVCDGSNNPTLTDNEVVIGEISSPRGVTTPYDLDVPSSSAENVDAITVATLLKSLNHSSVNGKLDLKGVNFNDGVTDTRASIQVLLQDPTADATLVLTTALFGDIDSINTVTFKHSDFLDETTVESELLSTLDQLASTKAFNENNVPGTTVVTPSGDTYSFATDYNTGSYFTFDGKVTVNGSKTYEWGIYSSGGNYGDAGDLIIDVGLQTPIGVKPISISDYHWVVSVDSGSEEVWIVK